MQPLNVWTKAKLRIRRLICKMTRAQSMTKLLNVDKAVQLILQEVTTNPSEQVDLMIAHGRILARDIFAPINQPPFANSAVDGYALIAEDVQEASEDSPCKLRVVLDITAGTLPDQPLQTGEAARIMTGAPLPIQANAVIPVEQTDAPWSIHQPELPEHITIKQRLESGDNVRPVGESIKAGELALEAGRPLHAAEIGLLASLGISVVDVVQRPRIAILSSGDELLEIHEQLKPGTIYDANTYTLASLVVENGGIPIRVPIARDTRKSIQAMFEAALLQEPDLIVSSAGVSVGAVDLIRSVLEEMGEIGFWRINLRPGKPLAFGKLRNIPFFGLPGNPVSALVTFDVLVRPALLKIAGAPDNSIYQTAIVGEDITSDGRRSYVRVRLQQQDNHWVAFLTGTQSSGALTSMIKADALLIIPEGTTVVEKGTELPIKLLRNRQITSKHHT